jgi:DNA-binding LacI/PurR family transcriptional regulator
MTKPSKPRNLQMADIARIAGVSKSTVSRALADSPLVSQQTKDFIKQIAQENNYRLNIAASNFRKKNHLTVSVLLPTADEAHWRLSNPFFLEILGAIADALDSHGHQLLLSRTSPQTGSWIEEFAQKNIADGLILIGQGSQHEAIDKLAKQYPAMSVWGAKIDDDQAYSVVGTDNFLGGYRATEHLIKTGRKHIGFIAKTNMPEAHQRYQGFVAAMSDHELSVNAKLVPPERSESDDYKAVLDLLATGQPIDGLVTTSDLHAMASIRAITDSGRRVPDDIAVIGYDDLPVARYFSPPLSTIRQDLTLGGQLLVEKLLEAIDGKNPRATVLDPELIIRESS